MFTRRQFIQSTSLAAAASGLSSLSNAWASVPTGFRGTLCFFSKHLPMLAPGPMARAVKALGLDGIDLTVRPGGHIAPERVTEDLPNAFRAINDAGLSVPMITTNLTSVDDPAARPTLATAGKLGIPFFKPGYYKYAFQDIRKELDAFAKHFTALVELGKSAGVQAGYHNHEGYLGAPVWDTASVIDKLDPKWAGYYFDVRHAVAEGGGAGWKIAYKLVAPRIKMIAVKDSYWEKTAKGWKQRNCPLGEGQVDWPAYFKLLSEANFHGPISLHLEYDIPGKTNAEREANTLAAAASDIAFLKARIKEAYSRERPAQPAHHHD